MDDSDDLPGSESKQIVERGQTYNHLEHGSVEVTGIWKGVRRADAARHTDETGVIIVRYSTEQDGDPVSELTETLNEFIEATES